jgi:hypothetical protein
MTLVIMMAVQFAVSRVRFHVHMFGTHAILGKPAPTPVGGAADKAAHSELQCRSFVTGRQMARQ